MTITTYLSPHAAAQPVPFGAGTEALRERLALEIEARIALLDAIDGDPDFEPSLGAIEAVFTDYALHGNRRSFLDTGGMDQTAWGEGDRDDREAGDDNGIADYGGEAEQLGHVMFASVDELFRADGQRRSFPRGCAL